MDKTGFDWLTQILQFLQNNFANIASIFSLFLVTFGPIVGPPIKKYLSKTLDKILNRDEYNKNLQKLEIDNEKTSSEIDDFQANAAKTNVETAKTLLEQQRKVFDQEKTFFMQKLDGMEETIRVNGSIIVEVREKYDAILQENKEIKETNKKIEDENVLLSQNNTEITKKLNALQKENSEIKEENQKTKNESLEIHKENRQLKKTVDKLKNLISELQGFVKKLMLGINKLIKAYEDDHRDKNIPWRPPELSEREERMLSDDYLKEDG